MLVVNPLNRITIHEIMEDEWFKVGFPEYLLPANVTEKRQIQPSEADEDVIAALTVAMGYSRDEILEAIKLGRRKETEEILDAYELMKDNRILVDDIKKSHPLVASQGSSTPGTPDITQQQQQFTQQQISQQQQQQLQQNQQNGESSASSWRTPTGLDDLNSRGNGQNSLSQDLSNNPSSTIAILPTSLPQLHRASMIQNNPQLANVQPIATKKSKTRWHFGIRSRSYPLDVMGEIYRALKNLGAEWIRPSEEELWTIKVRWKYAPNVQNNQNGQSSTNDDSVVVVAPDLMKMQIQLFQLEPNNYLVDFKFDGWENSNNSQSNTNSDEDEISSFSAYPFLHLATRLIMELAVNSQGS
ncbi:unnamed protein product [[Candida] boidinii]|nr:unnamed protein product [[Candida] boidinii]